MSEGPSQFKPRIDAVDDKVNKSLTEAIAAVKEVITRKTLLYSVDVESLDFEALKELEVEYKRVSDMASKALSMRAQAKFAGTLDKSITKVEKSKELTGKLNAAGSGEEQEKIMKEIETTLDGM
jgi:hypothetical protein|tara:strand:+ start:150 stop:521 length:372 start_codon:yes stop_codon:yes gene_type:complete